jgi:hypothetical protein
MLPHIGPISSKSFGFCAGMIRHVPVNRLNGIQEVGGSTPLGSTKSKTQLKAPGRLERPEVFWKAASSTTLVIAGLDPATHVGPGRQARDLARADAAAPSALVVGCRVKPGK